MSEDQALFSQFLSTGRNCEFGIVQKWSEATRLGLLDWLATTPYALLNMLKSGFEGIGEPQQTLLHVADTEYIIEDSRYRIRGHTWEQTTQIPREKSYDQACGRLKLLKRKMLEELRLGERIFVYKLNLLPVNLALMRDIADQIAGYGPGCLLGVFDARVNGKPDFHVEWAGPNLLLAYHPRLAPYEAAHQIDMEGWRQICRTALDMVAAGERIGRTAAFCRRNARIWLYISRRCNLPSGTARARREGKMRPAAITATSPAATAFIPPMKQTPGGRSICWNQPRSRKSMSSTAPKYANAAPA